MEDLIKQAKQGDARSQFRLGMTYYRGDRVEKNEDKAFEWWLKAADQGVEDACNIIGAKKLVILVSVYQTYWYSDGSYDT